ncbi:phage tail protein, partial [Salmonella enterica subsp. enterica serovar Kisarawe]|nr:phage tail protein [Salmonella enterica]EBH9882122.1 phage tail protein [Salmonella enterica subsp. enterica serovar Kisarawe]EEA9056558.1 phage tail protein [Salmonella enterica subsp. enterica]EAW4242005.1 phage tail protein [Salmonella enterica]EAY4504816.1 phage tail protein [Salmonella enterica]
VLGVPKWKRTVMYWAVRLFGRGRYARKQSPGKNEL